MGKIILGLVAILGLAAADSTCGGGTCLEACARQDHAAPNGDKGGAALSLFFGNADHLYPYGWGALAVPIVIGVYAIATRRRD